ncbi:MAG TPA: hypothetical protein V6D10_18650 [Trichocoleus sp.]|jgi:hypothetical protein
MADLNSVSRQDVDSDRYSNVITARRATPDEIAYRNGYVAGRRQEQRVQQRVQQQMRFTYAHRGMTGGILFGILLTLVVGSIATLLAIVSPHEQPAANQVTTSKTIQ